MTRAAAQVNLNDPEAIAWLLDALNKAGTGNAVQALLARDPAAHVRLDDPEGIARLLEALYGIGADNAIRTLLARDPACPGPRATAPTRTC
jgi:hypothetical protein